MFSFLKDHFPFSKIVIIGAMISPFILGLFNYEDVLFTDKSPIERIVNKNIKVNVGENFIVMEINEDKQRKNIKLNCTQNNCGLKDTGEYFLSSLEYAKVKNYSAFFQRHQNKIRYYYYLISICFNKKCTENLQDNFLNKEHEKILSQRNAYVTFFILLVIGLMSLPIGREIKSVAAEEIRRKYGVK